MSRRLRPFERIAYHEAGHGVASYFLHRRFRGVSIVLKDKYFGIVKRLGYEVHGFYPDIDSEIPKVRKNIEDEIMINFSGDIAEKLRAGRHNWKGAIVDNHNAISLASYAISNSDELNAYVSWLWIRTWNLISLPVCWYAIKKLADELLIQKEIKYEKARAIIIVAMKEFKIHQQNAMKEKVISVI